MPSGLYASRKVEPSEQPLVRPGRFGIDHRSGSCSMLFQLPPLGLPVQVGDVDFTPQLQVSAGLTRVRSESSGPTGQGRSVCDLLALL